MKTTFTCLTIFAIVISAMLPLQIVYSQTQQPTVSLGPSTVAATQLNQVFTLNITISNVQNLYGWAINVTWDSQFLTLVNKQEGNFLSDQVGGSQFAPLPVLDINYTRSDQDTSNNVGLKCLKLACSASTSSNGIQDSASGSGVLATVTFKVIKQAQATPITLSVENLLKPNPVPAENAVMGPHEQITPTSNTAVTQVSLILSGPPTANAGRERTVTQGTQIVFDASQSVSSGNATTYAWNFMDGTPQNLTGKITSYTFNNPGNYSVALTVQDSFGSDTSAVMIKVLPSSATPISSPTITPSPSDNSSSTITPTTTPFTATGVSPDPPQNTAFNLPPTIVGILVIFTLFVFGGSVFWLRKQM